MPSANPANFKQIVDMQRQNTHA